MLNIRQAAHAAIDNTYTPQPGDTVHVLNLFSPLPRGFTTRTVQKVNPGARTITLDPAPGMRADPGDTYLMAARNSTAGDGRCLLTDDERVKMLLILSLAQRGVDVHNGVGVPTSALRHLMDAMDAVDAGSGVRRAAW